MDRSFHSRLGIVACVLAGGVMLGGRFLQAAGTLELSYDASTGSLTSNPTPHDLRITSPAGLLTQLPTIGIEDYYVHFLRVLRSDADQPLAMGPVFEPNVPVDLLMQDLCVTAIKDPGPNGLRNNFFDPVLLNGQVLHSEPAVCERPPRELPPFSGERSGILQYDSLTGDLRLRSQTPITALEIRSQQRWFTGTPNEAEFLNFFDVARPDKLFKLWNSGFVEVDYGPVVQPGLRNHELLEDICVYGAWLGGGIAELDYAYPDAGTVPIQQCPESGGARKAALTLEYDESNGELAINASELSDLAVPTGAIPAEKALLLTTLDLRSESGIFTGPDAQNLEGSYDQHSPFRILKQDRDGFGYVNLGHVLAPGLSPEFVIADLKLDVTFRDGSGLGVVDVVPVPEPMHLVWWAVPLVLFRLRSRR